VIRAARSGDGGPPESGLSIQTFIRNLSSQSQPMRPTGQSAEKKRPRAGLAGSLLTTRRDRALVFMPSTNLSEDGEKTCDDFRAFGVVTPGIRKPLGGFDDKLGIERLALHVALHQCLRNTDLSNGSRSCGKSGRRWSRLLKSEQSGVVSA
jgi:hypothetical protein